MKMYNPDKCSSFEMMFGFPAPPPPKKKEKTKKEEK